jgi:hypothetical protein
MAMRKPMPMRSCRLIVATMLCVTIGGCGGPTGPPRYDVSGTIEFRGQPVPGGRIVFEPDTAHSNQGPAAYATIKDGKYATPPGKGTVGGPLIARVAGFDGTKHPSGEIPEGVQLFPECRLPIKLPYEHTSYNIEVPDGKQN